MLLNKFQLNISYKDCKTRNTNHSRWHRCSLSCEHFRCRGKQIKPRSQQWEASSLLLCQSDNFVFFYCQHKIIKGHCIYIDTVYPYLKLLFHLSIFFYVGWFLKKRKSECKCKWFSQSYEMWLLTRKTLYPSTKMYCVKPFSYAFLYTIINQSILIA